MTDLSTATINIGFEPSGLKQTCFASSGKEKWGILRN